MPQRSLATATISYAGYRFSSDVISYAVRQCHRFRLSLRVVEELRAELAQAVPLNGDDKGPACCAKRFDHRALPPALLCRRGRCAPGNATAPRSAGITLSGDFAITSFRGPS